MAKINPPSKTNKSNIEVKPTDQVAPEETTMLQIKTPLSVKNDFKSYTAKSPYKTMNELFKAMFEEYKNNHPI